MAKQKKKKHLNIQPIPREAIAAVGCEEDFVELLRRELQWPIPMAIQHLADVAIPHDLQTDFGFKPVEDRIAVSRLLNLTEDQPWGVFLFEFKTKRPYLSHLRRLLRVLGSQRTLRKGEPIWDRNDLLFICTPDWNQFQFVHFSGSKPESAVISTFGWKGPDDPFLHTLCRHNLPRLRMPPPSADGAYDADAWRTTWRDAFSVKPVTDEFYTTLKEVFDAVQSGVMGLEGENRRFFAELVVNRMVFLKFVEKKGWLDGDYNYLCNRFQVHGRKNYWRNFLCDFFFEGLCREKHQRPPKINKLLGDVPFLNAELFAPSDKWDDWAVEIENRVFDLLFDKLLNPYNFTVCETSPLEVEVAFNQDLLGYGYEELIADQHGQGAYYTHPTEVNLMCRESLRAYLEGRCPELSKELIGKLVYAELINDDRVSENDAIELYQALHDVTVVDPALGSGTFPVAMMKHLFLALRTLGEYLKDSKIFANLLVQDGVTDPENAFALKLHIIERSIYGCDIDYFAVQIAKLRFWIELMVDCERPEALPNFDCKLVVGDALVSFVGTDDNGKLITLEDLLGHPTRSMGQGNWIHLVGKQSVEKLASLKRQYFKVKDAKERKALEDQIAKIRDELLRSVGVQPEKIKRTDKHVLWQIDFAEIFTGGNPGFDISIANPPYVRQERIDEGFAAHGILGDKSGLRLVFTKTYHCQSSAKSDLYVYFFIRSVALLKNSTGALCFIVSNSWLDADYGDSLKSYITRESAVQFVIDSNVRSFAGADINTVITLILNRKPMPNERCRFLRLNERPGSVRLKTIIEEESLETCEEKFAIQRTADLQVLQKALSSGSQMEMTKWGGRFLRAPCFYDKILSSLSSKSVRLGSIATVRFGCHTGLNDFFYINSNALAEWDIEQRFLVPLLRSTKNAKSPIYETSIIQDWVVLCSLSKIEIRQKAPNLARYIEWAERQTTRARQQRTAGIPWPDVPSLKGREPGWWALPTSAAIRAPLFIQYVVGSYFKCPLADNIIVSDACFHRVIPKPGIDEYVLGALLNSSLTLLHILLFGRANLGQGALKFERSDAEQLLIPDPRSISRIGAKRMREIYNELGFKPYKPIIERNSDSFCAKIDEVIANELAIDKITLKNIHETIMDLVRTRLNKSQSAG